jgi:hypothetical protein
VGTHVPTLRVAEPWRVRSDEGSGRRASRTCVPTLRVGTRVKDFSVEAGKTLELEVVVK